MYTCKCLGMERSPHYLRQMTGSVSTAVRVIITPVLCNVYALLAHLNGANRPKPLTELLLINSGYSADEIIMTSDFLSLSYADIDAPGNDTASPTTREDVEGMVETKFMTKRRVRVSCACSMLFRSSVDSARSETMVR